MTEKTAEIRPPRKLKGRMARGYWRRLAPQVARDGALSPVSEQILLLLCRRLNFMATGTAHYDDVERVLKLAKQLGIKP
jgi:phage terminase small subunit